jgi:hypothetical protein
MALILIYFVLWAALLLTIVFSFRVGLAPTAIIGQISGLVGLSAALLQNLSKHSLPVYFFLQRLRLRLNWGAVTRWTFAARFDGDFDQDSLKQIIAFLSDPKSFSMPICVESQNSRQAIVTIDGSLVLTFTLELQEFSEANLAGGKDTAHFTVLSRVLELPYRYSVEKIQKQVVPLLTVLASQLTPARSSFELEVEFRGKNPFFQVYIAHLKPDQIDDFRVTLHVDSASPTRKDRVEIASKHVHISATSTDSLTRLASDFILLSPDVKVLLGAST